MCGVLRKWEEMFGETARHLAEGKRQRKGRLKGVCVSVRVHMHVSANHFLHQGRGRRWL